MVAEGAPFTAEDVHDYVNGVEGAYDSRVTVMGHVRRGGNPRASDLILASRLRHAAVEALVDGDDGKMMGVWGQRIERVPPEEVAGKSRPLGPGLYKMAEVFAELPE